MVMESVINQKYPQWHELERNPDGSARNMPAGVSFRLPRNRNTTRATSWSLPPPASSRLVRT